MRTHNLLGKLKVRNKPLVAAVLLVAGGLLSGFWLFGKSGCVEERAISEVGSAFVQTAQGANLDASQIMSVSNAAFSSLNSVSDLTNGNTSSIAYPLGTIKDSGALPVRK
jgi:hypothetical protein